MGLAMDVPIIVFAKAPRPGFAKTRLIPALGADGAAALATRMLAHTLREAAAAELGPVELCATPSTRDPALQAAAHATGAVLAEQGDGDLGARMHRAISRHLGNHAHALLIGTDAPAVDAAKLREAATALRAGAPVFIPALDGGYALVGLCRADERLFAGMRWGHAAVMHHTRMRMRTAGIVWRELAPVADIDEPGDLAHLPDGWLEALPARPSDR